MTILLYIAAFLVAIGVLVTVHEFGHFWVARKMGVKVLRFSIGFGKPLWTKTLGVDQTEYVIASIPLGGYVKMLDEREGEVAEHELDRAFNRKSVWRRFAVVLAGPAFNFIFAIAIYYLIYLAGIAGMKPIVGEVANPSPAYSAGIREMDTILSVNDIDTPSWEKTRFTLLEESVHNSSLKLKVQGSDFQIQNKIIDISNMSLLQEEQIDLIGDLGLSAWRPDIVPVIDSVLPDGAAAEAGILAGDQIISVDGTSITDVRQWIKMIRANPENKLSVVVLRDQTNVPLVLIPAAKDDKGTIIGFIGVNNLISIPDDVRAKIEVVERYGPVASLGMAVDKTWRISVLTLRVLGKLIIGEASVRNLSGPITIARYAGISASIGLEKFLGFLAIISISLGVLNLLPIPLLDGGHLLYYLVEIVKRSPVSETTELIGQKIGIALLFGLMSIAIYNDLLRLVE